MGPPFHHFFFLSGEFQMKPYAFKCNSALQVWPQEDVCPQGWGHALTYHSDNLKICWLKNCSPGLISDVYISLFEKWRYSSQLCYVSLPGGYFKKVVCFLGLGQTPGFVYMFISARGGCRYF